MGPHPSTTAPPKLATLGGTVSGGPTFGIPVLDTQEFYQGVMAPVSGQLFDFYIQQEFPREEIFTLFVEKIVISKQSPECIPPGRKAHTLECELAFVNSANSDLDFDLFQSLVEHLLNLGLTTEPVDSKSNSKAASCTSSSPFPGSSDNALLINASWRFCNIGGQRNGMHGVPVPWPPRPATGVCRSPGKISHSREQAHHQVAL